MLVRRADWVPFFANPVSSAISTVRLAQPLDHIAADIVSHLSTSQSAQPSSRPGQAQGRYVRKAGRNLRRGRVGACEIERSTDQAMRRGWP